MISNNSPGASRPQEPRSLELHVRSHGPTLVELLIFIGITSMLTALILPFIIVAREEANKVAEGGNPPAFLSLQNLVDTFPDEEVFEPSPEPSTTTWIGSPTKLTSRADLILASDDSILDEEHITENYPGGMNVVYVGTDAEWLPVDLLPEGYVLPAGLVNKADEDR